MELLRFRDSKLYNFIKTNKEIDAVVIAGVFMIVAFLLQSFEVALVPEILFVLSFIIGGFAPAKEGVQATIETHKLNVELLMIAAAIGAMIIGHWSEGALLIFIFALSGALETYANNKSRAEITKLMELQPDMASVILADGSIVEQPVESLVVGDRVLCRAGERIPVDGRILEGVSSINNAIITGESMPITGTVGTEVFAGSINLSAVITLEMMKPATESTLQKIIKMVQNAESEKPKSQLFIERFESIYVWIVIILAAVLIFAGPWLFAWDSGTAFYRGMVLLVVASPCALVASVMPAVLSAVSYCAKRGVLFKSGTALEQVADLKAIAFDKTGTLTQGTPVVTDMENTAHYSGDEFLQLAASIEQLSTHPLAEAIVRKAEERGLQLMRLSEYEDVAGLGVQARFGGSLYQIGTPKFIGDHDHAFIERAEILQREGKTLVYVGEDGKIIGILAMRDEVRESARLAITALKKAGITPIMLTGDNQHTASVIAQSAGIDTYIASCMPEDKVEHIKAFKAKYGAVAMVGDGINDAPALATANLGIAMGEGSDIALETADMVLMKNDLQRILFTIDLSKRMNKIIKQNIIFSTTIIVLLVLSNLFTLIDLPFGVVAHEGSTILVILNGLRLLVARNK